ncbi:MAG: pantetheine-phosphate adenylyltransferase [Halocynthiibacter sp.]
MLIQAIYLKYGYDFRNYAQASLKRRILRQLSMSGLNSISEMQHRLLNDPLFFENLLIDCAHDVGAQMIIRGLRAVADFEYEYQMVGMNRVLDGSVETVFLMAEARHQAIASKLVKEIARLGGDISKFVSEEVKAAVTAKYNGS